MMGGVPNQPSTPGRSVRVPDELWAAAMAKAKSEGTNLSEVIKAYLREYVADDSDDQAG